MGSFLKEFQQATKKVMRAPGWSAAVILTLVLAVGVNTATFSTFHSVLLRSLPYPDGEELVLIRDQYKGRGYFDLGMSEPELLEYISMSNRFEEIAASTGMEVDVGLGEKLKRLQAAAVTGNFFATLGVAPELGRIFDEEELTPGGSKVALIGYSLFESVLGGKEDNVGRTTLLIDDEPHLIIGVLGRDFVYPSDLGSQGSTELLLPLVINEAEPEHRGNPYLYAIGRLKDGVGIESAADEKNQIVRRLTAEHPGHYTSELGFDILLRPLLDDVVGELRQGLVLVLGMVLLTFLIALSNVVSLLLARLAQRRKEIGLRLALGAQLPGLLRQLGAEALVLAIPGGILGLLAGRWAFRQVATSGIQDIPRLTDNGLEPGVVLFSIVLVCLAACLMTIASVLHSGRTRNIEKVLREEASGTTSPAKRSWGRSVLVVAQVALSLCLLSAALLLIQSFLSTTKVELGFEPEGVELVELILPASTYSSGYGASNFYESLLNEVRALPGVEAAGLVGKVPLASHPEVWPVELEGVVQKEGGPPPGVEAQVVSHGYLEAMSIEVLHGESFPEVFDAESTPLVLINETMAELYWPNENPIGRRMRLLLVPDAPWLRVAGIVTSVKHADIVSEAKPQAFYHHRQIPAMIAGTAFRWMTLTAKSTGEVSGFHQAVVQTVQRLDPQITVPDSRSMTSVTEKVTAPLRFVLVILSVFALFALILTIVGLYGLISEMVALRRRDLAIRQALGAGRSSVIRLVLGEAFKLVGFGLLLGVGAAMALSPIVGHNLYGIQGFDLPTLFFIALILLCCAAVASFIPARRAVSPELLSEIRQS